MRPPADRLLRAPSALLLSSCVVLAACGDNGSSDDIDMAAAGSDSAVGADLAVAGDRDMARGPDLAVSTPDDLVMGDLAMLPDLTVVPSDLARPADAGVSCGNTFCAAGQPCCVSADFKSASCAAMCQQGELPFACEGPADCNGQPCCLTITDLMGARTLSGFTCGMSTDACTPALDAQNGGTLVSRRCTQNADCTAGGVMTNANQCCAATFGMQTVGVCFDGAFAASAMGLIACN